MHMLLPMMPAPSAHLDLSDWVLDFIEGTKPTVYGMLAGQTLGQRTFQAAAKILAKQNVILFAAQVDGEVRLNPKSAYILSEQTVSHLHR